MARAFLLILDSFGIGGAPDAAGFGDEGANTLGHICDHMKLHVPHMASLGLGRAAHRVGVVVFHPRGGGLRLVHDAPRAQSL